MKVKFLGAAGTVTGSKFLVESAETRILVDCGLFQGLKSLRLKNWASFEHDLSTIQAVVLTHAHIDHSGYLPVIAKNGFRSPIYATRPTIDLCRVLLPDAGRIQEEDAAFANKKGYSRHSPALPLFTEEDARKALLLFKPVEFHQTFQIGSLKITYYRAGHILGAASIRIEDDTQSIVFSGDLGRNNDLLMQNPETPPPSDWVVMESTYGDRLHSTKDPHHELAEIINRTLSRGGTILIPAFAVGRAQVLLLILHQLMEKKLIPDVPVFLDSPMATDATEIFLRYHNEHKVPEPVTRALCRRAKFINSTEDSRVLSHLQTPSIIVSASGMIAGGRILHHVTSYGPQTKNTIVLVGYQAAGTRGAALLDGAKSLKIHGAFVNILAEIAFVDSFSAHADQKDLLAWLAPVAKGSQGIILVHGEPLSLDRLRFIIQEEMKLPVTVPDPGQVLTLKKGL